MTRQLLRIFLLCWLASILIACQSLSMPPYDAKTDQLLTQTQHMTDKLLLDVEANLGLKKNRYASYGEQYKTILANLYVIRSRASALPHNQTTAKQITILMDSIRQLQTRHKLGFKHRAEIVHLQNLIDQQYQAVLKMELSKPKEAV